jgi:lipoate synthase
MFEKATRMKLRFNYRGSLSVEDLWDLSVEDLDTIFKTLKKLQKNTSEESLLKTRSMEDATLALQIDIVTHIFNIKVEEARAAEDAVEKKAKKQKILALLEKKKDAELEGKSADELEAMINDI